MFASTNATSLDDNYMEDHESTSEILLDGMLESDSSDMAPIFVKESYSRNWYFLRNKESL